MTTKYKVIIGLVALLLAFAAGRFTTKPQLAKVDTTAHTVADTTTQKDKDTHTVTTTVTKKDKTGAEVITQTTDTVTQARVDIKQDVTSDTRSITTFQKRQSTNVSIIGGIDFHTSKPTYGASVSREIVGPITVGVWGLSNLSGGVSIGVNF